MSTNKSFSSETSERYSRALFEVVNEAKELVEKGSREIILLGQNVNAYCSNENGRQYKLSDFIINQEDINDDGLFNIEDINVVADYLLYELPNNLSYDFNSDQNIDVFDLLIISDLIF